MQTGVGRDLEGKRGGLGQGPLFQELSHTAIIGSFSFDIRALEGPFPRLRDIEGHNGQSATTILFASPARRLLYKPFRSSSVMSFTTVFKNTDVYSL